MWTILMVTIEDEGRLMPIGMIHDEGRKILEAFYGDGNVIKGDRTFGATIHPKIQIVAQFTWNNKFHLSYKLVRVVSATCTLLAAFSVLGILFPWNQQNQKGISPQKISSRQSNVLMDSGSAFEGAGIIEEGINSGRYGRAGCRRNRF